jgi:LCP family protein required for cell wall assembly
MVAPRPTANSTLIKPRRWPRRILITANVLVAMTVVGVAGAYGYVRWRFDQIKTKNIATLTQKDTSSGQPFTMLIVGSDSRAAIAAGGDNSQFGGSSQVGGQRSDTIILVRVAPATRQLMMLSIPRDLWGPIPGHGSNRINSAFDTGAALLVQTIQQDLGIPINHYAEINFDTFRDISNAVGGVKFYFPTPARDAYSLLNIPAPGCYSLVGDQALAFVRSRHYQYYENGYWHTEGLSDLARIQRQQAFVKKMIKKAEGEFTNPIALNNVIAGVTKNLTVDSKFSTSLMLNLAKDFRTMNASGIPNATLPTYPFVTAGGAEVLGLQQPQAAQAIAAFNSFGSTPPPASKPSSPSSASKTPKINMPAVTVAPSSVNIEVANGTGAAGQAGQMSQWLSGLGYYSRVNSSSPGYGHATTEIHYAPDSLTAAEQVGAKMPGGAALVEDSSLTPTPYNLEVITGATYTAAAGSTGGQSSPAVSSTTTATTIPGANTSVYELPGSTGPPPASC